MKDTWQTNNPKAKKVTMSVSHKSLSLSLSQLLTPSASRPTLTPNTLGSGRQGAVRNNARDRCHLRSLASVSKYCYKYLEDLQLSSLIFYS